MKRIALSLSTLLFFAGCMNWGDARAGYCGKHSGFCDDGGSPAGGGGGTGGGEGGGVGGGVGGGEGGGAGGGAGGGGGGGGGQTDGGTNDGGAADAGLDAGPSDGFRTLFAISGGDPAATLQSLTVAGVAAAGPDTAVALDFKNTETSDGGITFGGLRISNRGNKAASCIVFIDAAGGVTLPIRPDGGQPTCILTGGSLSTDQMTGLGDGTVAVVGGISGGNGSLFETGPVGGGLNGVGWAAVVSSDGGIWGTTFPANAIATAVATNGKYIVIAGPYSGAMTINGQSITGQRGAFIAVENMNGSPVTAMYTDCSIDTSYVAHLVVDAQDNIVVTTASGPSNSISCTYRAGSQSTAFTTGQAGLFRLKHLTGSTWTFDWSSPDPLTHITGMNGALYGATDYLGTARFSDGGTVAGDPQDAGSDGGRSILVERIDPANGQILAAARAPFPNGASLVQIQGAPSGGWLLADVPCCGGGAQGPSLWQFGSDLSWGPSFVAPTILDNPPLALDVGPDGALRVGGKVSGTVELPPPLGSDAGVVLGNLGSASVPDVWVAKVRPPL